MDRRDFLKAITAGAAALGLGVGTAVLDRVKAGRPKSVKLPAGWYERVHIYRQDMVQLGDEEKLHRFVQLKMEQAKKRLQVRLEQDLCSIEECNVSVEGPFDMTLQGQAGDHYMVTAWRR